MIRKFGGSGIDKEVYDWIVDNLADGSTLLEIGSGPTSTQYLAEKYRMYSVEHDERYINSFNSRYFHAALTPYKRLGGARNLWYDRDVVRQLPDDYDMILVDGPIVQKHRLGFQDHLRLFRPDVPMIFHDTDRPIEHKMVGDVARMLDRAVQDFPSKPFMRVIV